MSRPRRLGLFVLLSLLTASGVLAASSEAPEERDPAALERLQSEVDARRARVLDVTRQEQGVLETLEGIDRATLEVSQDVARARREARAAEAALAAAEANAARLESASASTRAALSRRAVALYREGRGGPLQFLAGAESLPDLLRRWRALQRGVERDAELVSRARMERAAVATARAEAATVARVSAAASQRLGARASALEAEQESKRSLLEALRADATRERRALIELEGAARALEQTLVGLGAIAPRQTLPNAAPATPFTSLRGRLAAPVLAPVARRFGRVVDAEFRTAIFRKGIDFAAPAGSRVRAVAPGEVRFAGWFRGYGKMVILDHGEGYFTVSAHLEEIPVAVGEAVSVDQTIGTVGTTGSLGGPLLYFEIRRGSEPLDPSHWLAGGTGLE